MITYVEEEKRTVLRSTRGFATLNQLRVSILGISVSNRQKNAKSCSTEGCDLSTSETHAPLYRPGPDLGNTPVPESPAFPAKAWFKLRKKHVLFSVYEGGSSK